MSRKVKIEANHESQLRLRPLCRIPGQDLLGRKLAELGFSKADEAAVGWSLWGEEYLVFLKQDRDGNIWELNYYGGPSDFMAFWSKAESAFGCDFASDDCPEFWGFPNQDELDEWQFRLAYDGTTQEELQVLLQRQWGDFPGAFGRRENVIAFHILESFPSLREHHHQRALLDMVEDVSRVDGPLEITICGFDGRSVIPRE